MVKNQNNFNFNKTKHNCNQTRIYCKSLSKKINLTQQANITVVIINTRKKLTDLEKKSENVNFCPKSCENPKIISATILSRSR